MSPAFLVKTTTATRAAGSAFLGRAALVRWSERASDPSTGGQIHKSEPHTRTLTAWGSQCPFRLRSLPAMSSAETSTPQLPGPSRKSHLRFHGDGGPKLCPVVNISHRGGLALWLSPGSAPRIASLPYANLKRDMKTQWLLVRHTTSSASV